MNARLRSYLIVAVAAAILVVLALNIVAPVKTDTYDQTNWMWIGGLMAFPVAAALVLSHRPDNRVGWALGLSAVSAGLIFLLTWYAATYQDAPLSSELEAIERVPAVGQFAGIIGLLYLFPTGRCATAWYARIFALFGAIMLTLAIVWMLSPTPLEVTQRDNPLAVMPESIGNIADGGFVILLPFALIGLTSLVVRWRRAGLVERSQLKWFLCGAIFVISILFLANAVPGDDDEAGVALAIGGLVVITAFWSLPAAIVIAILRYHLYDIDRIINRALVYAALSATLGVLYAGLVIGLQEALSSFSGGSDLAVVVTTLIVAALFMPVRRHLQDVVDRRFNRRQYDAARTVDAFSARLRQQIDLDTLSQELLMVVQETMAPAKTSMLLTRRNDLGTS